MSNTPRTDALFEETASNYPDEERNALVGHARQLEAELGDQEALAGVLQSALHKANARIADLEASKIHSCHENCQRVECVQRRRIAELESQLEAHAWKTSPAMAQATMDAQAKRIAELEKDKARLDWLEKYGATPMCSRLAIDAYLARHPRT